jgi:hypothetical protein
MPNVILVLAMNSTPMYEGIPSNMTHMTVDNSMIRKGRFLSFYNIYRETDPNDKSTTLTYKRYEPPTCNCT